jgi:glycosyltransferase involved in cell wall biosynthesis
MQVAVFHPGTQHSWQTALALQQLGRLVWYATSIFYQPDRFPYRLERYLPGVLARRLHAEFRRFSHPVVDPALVRTSGMAEWVERVAARAGFRELAMRIDRFGNDRFVAQIARDIASDAPFALWGYNGSSLTSFELARRYGRTCILDRTNGDFRAYNDAMALIQNRYGDWFLPMERSVSADEIARDDREYSIADTILAGSPFAAATIRERASDPAVAGKVRVLNYCFDEALFAGVPPPLLRDRKAPLRFLFLGLAIPRKGIHHVLEAILQIPASQAELTIVGDLKVPAKAFAPYADRVTYIPTVARADVPSMMAAHDVFLFPSYFEGAGITLYEALASGCGLIQSRNAALAATPETGIMLDRVDTETLLAAMVEAISDRDRVEGWRAAAQAEARNYSFAIYRRNISDLLDQLGI